MDDYYVYVYVDPRNFEEFYFGKGRGGRKNAHLTDGSDSEKSKRITAIKKAGLEPIVRVIARGLSEHDALLVEKTLLWKLGRRLTNISSGHYAKAFRPHDTMDRTLAGFDFRTGLYYYNVGDGPHRNWEDYVKFGFISGGHGPRWRKAMLRFEPGDVVAAYLKRAGFVGIGRVVSKAKPIREVQIQGKPLLAQKLRCSRMGDDVASDLICEYVAPVKWIRTTDRAGAYWKARAGLFTTTHVRASLVRQPKTIRYLERVFQVDVAALVG